MFIVLICCVKKFTIGKYTLISLITNVWAIRPVRNEWVLNENKNGYDDTS